MKSLPTWGICEPRGALTMEAAKLAPVVDRCSGRSWRACGPIRTVEGAPRPAPRLLFIGEASARPDQGLPGPGSP